MIAKLSQLLGGASEEKPGIFEYHALIFGGALLRGGGDGLRDGVATRFYHDCVFVPTQQT